MYDEVLFEYPLPKPVPKYFKNKPFFQTSDLGGTMGEWTITKKGKLFLNTNIMMGILSEALDVKPKPIPVVYKRKKIKLHGTNLRGSGPLNGEYVYYTDDGSDYVNIYYVVQIRDGKVSSIKETFRELKPALAINLAPWKQ